MSPYTPPLFPHSKRFVFVAVSTITLTVVAAGDVDEGKLSTVVLRGSLEHP